MMKEIKGVKSSSIEDSSKKTYTLPSFTLTSEDLPELKNWKVGGEYFLKVKVEQVSMGKGQSEWENTGKEEKKMHARFQILSLEAMKHMDSKENYENEYMRKRSNAPR